MTEPAQQARMLLMTPDGRSTQIVLPAGITTLGRAPDNKVRLEAEGVSRWHAMISIDPDGRVVLKDLASSNGTHVNGMKVDSAVLRAGDMFRMGRVSAHVLRPDADGSGGVEVDVDVGGMRRQPAAPAAGAPRAFARRFEPEPWQADLEALPTTLTLQLRQSALGAGGTG